MNLVFCTLMYFIVGIAWCIYWFWKKGEAFYRDFTAKTMGTKDDTIITIVLVAACLLVMVVWPIDVAIVVRSMFKKEEP